jgi:hypothetical protein
MRAGDTSNWKQNSTIKLQFVMHILSTSTMGYYPKHFSRGGSRPNLFIDFPHRLGGQTGAYKPLVLLLKSTEPAVFLVNT